MKVGKPLVKDNILKTNLYFKIIMLFSKFEGNESFFHFQLHRGCWQGGHRDGHHGMASGRDDAVPPSTPPLGAAHAQPQARLTPGR